MTSNTLEKDMADQEVIVYGKKTDIAAEAASKLDYVNAARDMRDITKNLNKTKLGGKSKKSKKSRKNKSKKSRKNKSSRQRY